MSKHTPNTTEPSKSHESSGHPYRHVDYYNYGEDGKKEGETHGVRESESFMEFLLGFFGGKKKD